MENEFEFNYFKKNNLHKILTQQQNIINNMAPAAKELFMSTIASAELDIVLRIENMVGIKNFALEFIQLQNIPQEADVEKLLIENRKKVMEKAFKGYAKECIKQNVLKPDESIDKNGEIKTVGILYDMINNYYDSLYARYNRLDLTKKLPEYDVKGFDVLKYDTFTKIKNGTGYVGIQNNYKNSKAESFAQYCTDKTLEYIGKFNKNVEDAYLKDKTNDVEFDLADVNFDDLGLEPVNVSNVTSKIPTMYHMLKHSYESRSTAERFFSYFPFINPKAKEERRALNTIKKSLEQACHYNVNEMHLNKLEEQAIYENMNSIYNGEIDKLKYIEEERKLNPSVEENNKINILVEPCNEKTSKQARIITDEDVERQMYKNLNDYIHR